MKKEYPLIPLFRHFVNDNRKGKRLKPDGQRIRKGTISNYENALHLLEGFQNKTGFFLRIRQLGKVVHRQYRTEVNYWKKFYFHFTNYLYTEHDCFDNYVGSIMKTLRSFFIYLNKEKQLAVGDFYKQLYVKRETIEIISIHPERLRMLINDKAFENSLPLFLRRIKDCFVFGCTVAVRFSDLFNIRMRDIEFVGGHYYLSVRSIKTSIATRVKLPACAMEIVNRNTRKKKKQGQTIPFNFPPSFQPEHSNNFA